MAKKVKKLKVKTKKSKDSCIILVAFERETTGDEMDTLIDNYKKGNIKADPEKDLKTALIQQLVIELQEAHDNGMAGFCQVKKIRLGREFHRDNFTPPEKPTKPKPNRKKAAAPAPQ